MNPLGGGCSFQYLQREDAFWFCALGLAHLSFWAGSAAPGLRLDFFSQSARAPGAAALSETGSVDSLRASPLHSGSSAQEGPAGSAQLINKQPLSVSVKGYTHRTSLKETTGNTKQQLIKQPRRTVARLSDV